MVDREIGRFRKDDKTEIVVQVKEYKGKVGLDIREYITSERYTGWSKSGVRIPDTEVRKLAKLVNSACAAIDPESGSSEADLMRS